MADEMTKNVDAFIAYESKQETSISRNIEDTKGSF